MESRIHEATDLGAQIRERRKALGYTQARIAALCGTGIRFISDLENGKATVELDKALKVAATLGIDIVARLRGTTT
jgi:y4mF family transcriptional regulator